MFIVFGLPSLRGVPPAIWAFALLGVACIAARAIAALVQLSRLPAQRRETAYQVTDCRILVTREVRGPHSWSAYLDQIADPILRPGQDGTADVVLRNRAARRDCGC